jgi:DNA-binding beta-propeller fold protein YncE
MLNKINKVVLGVLAAGSLAMSVRAQNNVYAVEFNTGNNRFGVINLMNGNFTEISSLGGTLYNDIAYAPDGSLFGIANNGSSLVAFDKTDGTVTTVASLNVPGLESIAFDPNNGVLFGAAFIPLIPPPGLSPLSGVSATLTTSTLRRTSVLTPMATSI